MVIYYPLKNGIKAQNQKRKRNFPRTRPKLSKKKLNLKYHSASLLELESGSNDPSAYTMTILFLSLIEGSPVFVPLLILKQVGYGLLFGFSMAYFIKTWLKYFDLKKDGLAIVFLFAIALFTYSVTDLFGGNGYLAVYILGISTGNREFKGKKDVVFFFDGFTELMSIFLFFLLGLLATPAKILIQLPKAFLIVLFMTFIARPISVFLLMAPFKLKKNQLLVLAWAGLRGAAAIAFAIMAMNTGYGFSLDIYHLVFGVCSLSLLLQGSLMPSLTRKLAMIDDQDSVLRTFNYYVDKGDISFIKTTIKENSPFVGKKLAETSIRGDFILAKILRNGKAIVPRGDVVPQAGDQVVLIGEEYFDPNAHDLLEFTITKDHPWEGKMLQDLQLPSDHLVLSVHRKGEFLKAEGKAKLQAGDRVILFQGEGE